MSLTLKILTWNIGFGSGKDQLKGDDMQRLLRMLQVYQEIDADAIAFQEIANRVYVNDKSFHFFKELSAKDKVLKQTHFEKALSLGGNNAYPYGKYSELLHELNIQKQETGIGIGIRKQNGWTLKNLFSDVADAIPNIEVQRALPHILYMGKDALTRAGRDEEDRPILWARLAHLDLPKALKIYLVSLHLPTLRGEEKDLATGDLNPTQQHIYQNILQLPPKKMSSKTVDDLGADLRIYILKQIDFQARHLEGFWKAENAENQCLFLFAGDFNFCHPSEFFTNKTPEFRFLKQQGYEPVKTMGSSRSGRARLHDNIWIKQPENSNVSFYSGFENPSLNTEALDLISDHYPVVGSINIK